MGLFCSLFILDIMTKKNLEESVGVFQVEKVVVRKELVKKRKQYVCNHSGMNQPSLKTKIIQSILPACPLTARLWTNQGTAGVQIGRPAGSRIG